MKICVLNLTEFLTDAVALVDFWKSIYDALQMHCECIKNWPESCSKINDFKLIEN